MKEKYEVIKQREMMHKYTCQREIKENVMRQVFVDVVCKHIIVIEC